MENNQIQINSLNEFISFKENQILNIAKQNTESLVKKELALMDFELLIAINLKKGESEKLTRRSRKLRSEVWGKLNKRSKGDYGKMCQDIKSF